MDTGNLLAFGGAIPGVLIVLYLATTKWRARLLAPAASASDVSWDAKSAVRELIDSLSGLSDLFQRLGFSLELERECHRLMGDLAEQIQVEIPDFPKLRQELEEIEALLFEGHGSHSSASAEQESGDSDPLASARQERRDDPLLKAVLAVKEDPGEIAQVLNRDPIGEVLPFIEQIPFSRAGRIVWRTPMEISVLRKQPRDPDRFQRLLDDLDGRVLGARIRRPPTAREAVLSGIGRCRRDLERNNAYFPTAIQNLESKLADWLMGLPNAPAVSRRRQFEKFLGRLAEWHHRKVERPEPRDRQDASRLPAHELQALADEYLRARWMHVPALTAYVLNLLLSVELESFSARQQRRPSSPGNIISLICDETAAGHYDGVETRRRLHQLEAKGTYIHSMIYALLRLHLPSDESES